MIRNFAHVLLPALALDLVASTSSVAQTFQAFTDDFNDGDDAGWTRYDAIGILTGGTVSSSYSFPGGSSYRIQAAGSPIPQALGPSRAGSARLDINHFGFFSNSVDIIDWDDTLDQAFGLVAHANEIGPGTTDAYVLTYSAANHQFAINRLENEMEVDLESAAFDDEYFVDITLDPARDYRFEFTGFYPSLVGELYELTDLVNPLATVVGFDTTHISGVPGVLSVFSFNPGTTDFTTGTDTTFDNFAAAGFVIPEPASLGMTVLGAAVLLSRKRRRHA